MPDPPGCPTLKLLSSVPTVQPESTLPRLQVLRSRQAAWAAPHAMGAYALRHTMARTMMRIGVDLSGTALQLGHSARHLGDEGIGVYLAMRVMQRDADLDAAILER